MLIINIYHAVTLAPSPPRNVAAMNINSRNATISWSEPEFPNGNILLYNIVLTDDELGSVLNVNSTSTELFLVLENLRPFTDYTVIINAMNSITREDSSPVFFTTMEESEYAK